MYTWPWLTSQSLLSLTHGTSRPIRGLWKIGFPLRCLLYSGVELELLMTIFEAKGHESSRGWSHHTGKQGGGTDGERMMFNFKPWMQPALSPWASWLYVIFGLSIFYLEIFHLEHKDSWLNILNLSTWASYSPPPPSQFPHLLTGENKIYLTGSCKISMR